MPLTPTHLAACGVGNGFAAVAFDQVGAELWRHNLGYRAHDVIADPSRTLCAIVGRKPGPMVTLCDLATGTVLRSFEPLPNCTFDGHAVFSPCGDLLYTTQSEGREQVGRIAIYNVADGTVQNSFSSHGIEPHELLWSIDGQALIVGNGGIVDRNSTDPIHSSLVRMDALTGVCRTKTVLDEDFETLSLRHLARLADGRIAFGAQDQDPATDLRPLVGTIDERGTVAFLEMPTDIHRRMAGYIGSVAVDGSGTVICATSPRGGIAAFWASADGQYLGAVDLSDTCGIAGRMGPGEFLLTSGRGARLEIRVDLHPAHIAPSSLRPHDPLQWDNHLSLIRRS